MQYERNDTIIYDEGFQTTAAKEYCISEEKSDSSEINQEIIKKTKKASSNSVVLVTQLIICIMCAVFLYVTGTYFSEIYGPVKENLKKWISDSLIIDNNDLNDYFVRK